MEYYFNRLNFVLVILVGGLCVYQWSGEKRADREIEALRHSVNVAEDHIAAQDQTIRGANEDIDEFKKIIADAKTKTDESDKTIRDQKAKIFTLEQHSKHLEVEANLAAKSITAYKAGIADRDSNVQLLLDQREKLLSANQDAANKANSAIKAYNDLATKYASLVEQYNDLGRRYQALTTPPPKDGKDAKTKPNA